MPGQIGRFIGKGIRVAKGIENGIRAANLSEQATSKAVKTGSKQMGYVFTSDGIDTGPEANNAFRKYEPGRIAQNGVSHRMDKTGNDRLARITKIAQLARKKGNVLRTDTSKK